MARYSRNFLDSVILNIQFDDISLGPLADFRESVKTTFDIPKQINGFQGSINFNADEGTVEQVKKDVVQWNFTSTTSPNKALNLSQNFIAIEYTNNSYKDSDELLNDVETFFNKFIDEFGVKIINRTGLRYVNTIPGFGAKTKEEWAEYINPELLGNIGYLESIDAVAARAFAQSYLKFDNYDVNFYSGIWNGNFPNAISGEGFVLDYDCFSTIPLNASELSLKDRVKEFNGAIEKLFEASITDKLRERLNDAEK